MTLPKKKSRNIEIDSVKYRWLISKHNDVLHLSVETEENPQQLLQAFFEPHDAYEKENYHWLKISQGVSITPKLVKNVVKHALANGWQPNQKSDRVFTIHSWQTDAMISLPSLDVEKIRVKDIAIQQVSDLRFDLSLDSHWRKILFDAKVGKKFVLPNSYPVLSKKVRDLSLKFAVYNAGYTNYGFIVFAIASVDFPNVETFTVNNPELI